MEKEFKNGKRDNSDLKEVVYIPGDGDQTDTVLLKSAPSDSSFLYIAAFTADLVMFVAGASFAWSSPVFSILGNPNPKENPLGEPITSYQKSWVASLLCLGAAVGPLVAGRFADGIGRKKTLLLLTCPMGLSYMALAFFIDIKIYYIARFVLGVGVGSGFAVLPMYLGEITEDHNRGKFGCIMIVFTTLGLLYPLAVGPLVSIKLLSFSCTLPLMLFFIFFSLFIPESPVYLVTVGRIKDAREALTKLRNKSSNDVEEELMRIKKTASEESNEKGGIGEILSNASLRRGLTVSIGLVILQQLSGINAVIAFLGAIFEATGSGISAYMCTNAVAVIQVIATILAAALVERLGRKLLLMVSTIGSCASILLLGLYFYLQTNKIYNVESIFWLPVVCVIVYIVSFNAGLGSLPWAIMAEIFPASVKSTASALTSFSCFLVSFGVTLGFPIIEANFGMAQCFWLFGSCCLFGIFFIGCVVPETKGKSLAEIQQLLGKK